MGEVSERNPMEPSTDPSFAGVAARPCVLAPRPLGTRPPGRSTQPRARGRWYLVRAQTSGNSPRVRACNARPLAGGRRIAGPRLWPPWDIV